MSENFAELFEESLQTVEMNPGAIITGVIIDVDKDWVTVHAGLKSEGVIPADQFAINWRFKPHTLFANFAHIP